MRTTVRQIPAIYYRVTSDSMMNGRIHVSYYSSQVIYGEVLQNPTVAWLVKKSLLQNR